MIGIFIGLHFSLKFYRELRKIAPYARRWGMYWILLFTVLIWYAPYCVSNSANDMNIVQMSTLVFLPVIAIWMIRSLTLYFTFSTYEERGSIASYRRSFIRCDGISFRVHMARWE